MTTPLFVGAIAAMTQDRIIGTQGQLPWHYPEDLKAFKKKTLNSTIIMGRLTFDSLNNKPLPKRRNIVLTRNAEYSMENNGVECFSSLENALAACGDDKCWIIGGGQIYRLAMPYLTTLDITYVPDVISCPDATIFPEIDPEVWTPVETNAIENTPLVNVIYHRTTAPSSTHQDA